MNNESQLDEDEIIIAIYVVCGMAIAIFPPIALILIPLVIVSLPFLGVYYLFKKLSS